jgi:hypothetical protein
VIRLLARFGLVEPIKERVRDGMPFWGTCMGMIVAAHDVADLEQETLDLSTSPCAAMRSGAKSIRPRSPLRFRRSASGRFPAIFIRAPWIERAGPAVDRARRARRPRRHGPSGQRARHLVPPGTDRRRPRPRILSVDARRCRAGPSGHEVNPRRARRSEGPCGRRLAPVHHGAGQRNGAAPGVRARTSPRPVDRSEVTSPRFLRTAPFDLAHRSRSERP